MPTKIKGTTGVDKIESGAVITNPAFSGDATVSGSLTIAGETAATQNSLGVRNLIINGDMRIAQRGTSATGKTTASYYSIDRMFNNIASAGTWTISQDTDVPTGQGFSNSLKYQCTTADASLTGLVQLFQKIEGQNAIHLKYGTSNAKTTTFSFWVKSNKTGTYIYEVFQQDAFRSISKLFTINSADTWEKKTIAIEGDTSGVINNDNGEGFRVTIWLAAGSDYTSGTLQTSWGTLTTANRAVGQVNLADSTSNYINITGVQLEVGDTATPFEQRPYDMELRRCQRYFEHNYGTGYAIGSAKAYPNNVGCEINGFTTSNGQKWYSVPYKVTKRAVPNLTIYDANGNVGKVTVLDLGGTPTHNTNIGIVFINDTFVSAGASNNTYSGVTYFFVSEAEV